MKIKIYRGTNEVGGTCVEIVADNNKVLWIDLGLPLDESNPDISYRHNKVDALLISHPHSDHFGLMESVGPDTPVYIGPTSLELILATKRFLNENAPNCNFKRFESWQPFTIDGTFTVHPYLVDHSSPEAFAFVIEADGKRLFYSGDFRSTGRKGKLYTKMLKQPPTGIDIMLVEGTMVERDRQEYETEAKVEEEFIRLIRTQQNMTFVVSSAQNIDRFCSVFKACKVNRKKIIIDIYSAFILEIVSKKANKLPTLASDGLFVYSNPSQFQKISEEKFSNFRTLIQTKKVPDNIYSRPSDYVYFLRCPNEKLISKIYQNKPINLIYSQWLGYLSEPHKTHASDTINRLRIQDGINFKHIHTSGHATMEDIFELTKAINPRRIVPIHTSNPQKFKEYFNSNLVYSVECWEDKMIVEI